MKILICLVLCALAATTYAAPARFNLQDRAEMEGFFDFIKKAGKGLLKAAPHIIGALGDGVNVQDDDEDDNNDDLANIEALLSQSFQDRAEMEGFFDFIKKAGKGLLKAAPHIIGALGDGVNVQDDDDDDDEDDNHLANANIEALLSQALQDRAQEQRLKQAEAQFWGSLLKGGLKLLGKKK